MSRVWTGNERLTPMLAAMLLSACYGDFHLEPLESTPGDCADSAPVMDIAMGDAHGCAIRTDGQIVCWGKAQRTGTGTDQGTVLPQVLSSAKSYDAIFAGSEVTCARSDESGELLCWGEVDGALPIDPVPSTAVLAPSAESSSSQPWHFASLSSGRGCGVRGGAGVDDSGSEVFCWGDIALCPGDGGTVPSPLDSGASRSYRSVAVGETHVCLVSNEAGAADGTLYCFGTGAEGQLGRSGDAACPTVIADNPQPGPWTTSGWHSVQVAGQRTCALRPSEADGDMNELYCFGDGVSEPTLVSNGSDPMASSWVEVALGSEHACARTSRGDVYCWGSGQDGRLGLGDTGDRAQPTRVTGGPSGGFARVAVSETGGCGIDADGMLWCWGSNEDGRLGQPGGPSMFISPTQVCIP